MSQQAAVECCPVLPLCPTSSLRMPFLALLVPGDTGSSRALISPPSGWHGPFLQTDQHFLPAALVLSPHLYQ